MLRAHGCGRFVADPVLEQVNGTFVCRFSLAFEEHRKSMDGEKKKNVSFVDCQCWGSAAETIGKYCKKGEQFFVADATVRQDSWVTDDGDKRQKLYLRINSFDLINKRYKNEQEEEGKSPLL